MKVKVSEVIKLKPDWYWIDNGQRKRVILITWDGTFNNPFPDQQCPVAELEYFVMGDERLSQFSDLPQDAWIERVQPMTA